MNKMWNTIKIDIHTLNDTMRNTLHFNMLVF
mgnify:CR=1 FL=1